MSDTDDVTTTLEPRIVDDFLSTVVRCLRATVGVEAVISAVGEASERTQPMIVVAIDFVGDVRGPITWVFPPEIALELVRRLMDEPDPPADTVNDGATELANILTGHASEALHAQGIRCEFGTPRVHEGPLPRGLVSRMTTADGPIDVVLSLSAA